MAVSQKLKHRMTTEPSNSTCRYTHTHTHTHTHTQLNTSMQRNTCTNMIAGAMLQEFKRWKQPKHGSMGKQITELWYIQATEYYSAIKRNEAVICSTMWMNLRNIMLSEKNQ